MIFLGGLSIAWEKMLMNVEKLKEVANTQKNQNQETKIFIPEW